MKLRTNLQKKAQIGETMTWIVATVIIIVILIFSIFVTGIVGKDKEFKIWPKKDLLATKSLSGYLSTQDDSGKKVFEQLKEEQDLNDFNGNLAKKIFEGLYKLSYNHVIWLGINFEGFSLDRKNDYFGSYARTYRKKGGDISWGYYFSVSEKINLTEDKWIELILMRK